MLLIQVNASLCTSAVRTIVQSIIWMGRSWNQLQKKRTLESLSLKTHCVFNNKASKMLGLINRNILYRSKDIMVPLYKSLVHPHLKYCIVAWSPHYQKDKILLERIQRRFTRMILGIKKLPYESRQKCIQLVREKLTIFTYRQCISGIVVYSSF